MQYLSFFPLIFFQENVHISVCVWEDALPQDADIMIGRHVDAFNWFL